MDDKTEALKRRTKRFAIDILDFIDTMPRSIGGEYLARQLVRAGFGVAGNYRGACRGRSHTEFTARLGVVLEEADESELWLDVSDEKKYGEPTARKKLLNESRELCAMFSKACITARSRQRRRL